MSKILIESQYLPPIATFSAIKKAEEVVFDLHSYYVKGTYRNRCHICVANGLQRLSVPLVKGKHQKTILKDVKISYDEDWRKDHWQSIISAYGRSAFFDFYRDDFEALLFSNYTYLTELNATIFNWLLEELGLSIKISSTSKYIEAGESETDWIELRNKIHPQEKKNRFDFEPQSYEQVFANHLDFIPNLSIIDLLFTQGPMAKHFF